MASTGTSTQQQHRIRSRKEKEAKRTGPYLVIVGVGLGAGLMALGTQLVDEPRAPIASEASLLAASTPNVARYRDRAYYETIIGEAERTAALHEQALERLQHDPRWEMKGQRIGLSVATSTTMRTIRDERGRAEEARRLLHESASTLAMR